MATAAVLGQPLAGLAIGSSLMVMIYMGGHISGAHYNPAVSLAVLIRGKVSIVDFVIYVICQMAGACAAATSHVFLPIRMASTSFE